MIAGSCPSTRCSSAASCPLTMGGGHRPVRVSMLLLGKAHIGEVQVSLWDEDTLRACDASGIILL